MNENTQIGEMPLLNKKIEKTSQAYLAEDGTKLYEIKRSDLKNELRGISSNKHIIATIYGDFLGTAQNVIETLEALCQTYYIFLLLDIAENNSEFVKKILCIDVLASDDYAYSLEKHSGHRYILPSEELVIDKVSFNSPGFWEVIGALNPLTQIREYINDRHNRKKDKQFWETELSKNILENQKLELENQKLALQNQEYSIELSFKKVAFTKEVYSILKDAGCSEIELRKFTNDCVSVLTKLEHCIDDNRITEVEIEE